MRIGGVKNDALALSCAGSGDLHAAGKTDRLAVRVAGSGDVFAFDVQARVVSAAIAGSGDVRVSVSEALKVKIAGSGDVHYKGDPQVVTSILGSGRVRKVESQAPGPVDRS
jgi:hypothetical protein